MQSKAAALSRAVHQWRHFSKYNKVRGGVEEAVILRKRSHVQLTTSRPIIISSSTIIIFGVSVILLAHLSLLEERETE